MNDPGGVRGGKGRCHLLGDIQYVIQLQLSLVNQFADRLPINELGGNETCSLRLADFMNRKDIWMVKSRGRLRFPLKPAQPRIVRSEVGRQNLQRYQSTEPRVLG